MGEHVGTRSGLSAVADVIEWWPIRYAVGPAMFGAAQFQETGRVQAGLFMGGLLFVEGANVITARRRDRAEDETRASEKARRELEETLRVQQAQRRLTQLLIDVVTQLEIMDGGAVGRFRAAVFLPAGGDQETLAMAYLTPGFSRDEQALEWAAGQGAVGEAWTNNKLVTAPDASRPELSRRWGMNAAQKRATTEVNMVVAHPVPPEDSPAKCVAVFTIDDTVPPGDYADVVGEIVRRFAPRVATLLAEANFTFPE